MNSRTILWSLRTLAVILLTGAALTGSAGARDNAPAASGQGVFTFQFETISFSFHAKEHKKGADKGRARFANLSDGTEVIVDINCLNVGGFSASLSGVVVRSDDPALPEGSAVVFGVTDWDAVGANRPDEITPLFILPPGFDCYEAFPLTILPLTEGDIIVRP